MEWYWWILIVFAVIVLGALKVWLVPKWMKKQREKKAAREKLSGDGE